MSYAPCGAMEYIIPMLGLIVLYVALHHHGGSEDYEIGDISSLQDLRPLDMSSGPGIETSRPWIPTSHPEIQERILGISVVPILGIPDMAHSIHAVRDAYNTI